MNRGKESKPHIGIFGRRNVGKSSIINALTGQETAIVSDQGGTTTDPVKKSLEIQGIGPSVLVDTAGIDDVGTLGVKRIEKSLKVVDSIDAALLVISHNNFGNPEEKMIALFQKRHIPFIVINNKSDQIPSAGEYIGYVKEKYGVDVLSFSATDSSNINELVAVLRKIIPETSYQRKSLLGDIVKPDDVVLLIAPQDSEAPEGRLILPQVQVIRDLLDNNCIAVITKVNEAETFLKRMRPKPALVITDSQVFHEVKQFVPEDIALTGFSIVLARRHAAFPDYIKGTPKIAALKNGDRILILESCTHQVTCEDIGRHKIPDWMRHYTGKELEFDIISGLDNIKRPLADYALVIQCGGCVLTKKQVDNRIGQPAHNIPVSNYGMVIAFMQGIFDRAVQPFLK